MEIHKQTLLIVDDALTNIEMLSIALDTEYEVFFATSDQEALDSNSDLENESLSFCLCEHLKGAWQSH
jgi:PleD family two-component response regulator